MSRDDVDVDAVRRLADRMRTERPGRPDPPYRIVHPETYAYRLTCPLWTNVANPDHKHDVRCWRD